VLHQRLRLSGSGMLRVMDFHLGEGGMGLQFDAKMARGECCGQLRLVREMRGKLRKTFEAFSCYGG
jgi:hypothetical protein